MSREQMIYQFSQGSKEMKSLLGGKGANLAEMTRLGLPVPPGFIVSTEACNLYFTRGRQIWPELAQELEDNLKLLEQQTQRRFGGSEAPLLLSVRSGAVISMPGMMDTILNLGLNRATVEALAGETANRRFALDCYRRFIQMFAEVVLKVDHYHFENILHDIKDRRGLDSDAALLPEDLEQVIDLFFEVVRRETGTPSIAKRRTVRLH
ncbi:MAG TPA: PEP/pyruvate-binding domain-containing protein, partial [Bacillota bacterium]|nr:PEP/pyruvate-binding domain-containing protein [Bacillota bacterium]